MRRARPNDPTLIEVAERTFDEDPTVVDEVEELRTREVLPLRARRAAAPTVRRVPPQPPVPARRRRRVQIGAAVGALCLGLGVAAWARQAATGPARTEYLMAQCAAGMDDGPADEGEGAAADTPEVEQALARTAQALEQGRLTEALYHLRRQPLLGATPAASLLAQILGERVGAAQPGRPLGDGQVETLPVTFWSKLLRSRKARR